MQVKPKGRIKKSSRVYDWIFSLVMLVVRPHCANVQLVHILLKCVEIAFLCYFQAKN
jgi:hypothetical protein